ncbi:MAG: hypothetical protein ACJ8I9_06640 [Chthoniobacterales bacterium]
MTFDRIDHQQRAALVIAHPGHELRVHRWLEIARPSVFVLTDGSGRSGRSRLAATRNVINAAGARIGPVYGLWTDHGIYHAIRRQEVDELVQLAKTLASELLAAGIDYVVADAVEGYNPSHDICRYIVDAVVEYLAQVGERSVQSYEFLLVGRPDVCPDELQDASLCVQLDPAATARKIAAARGYAELKSEVDAAVAQFGESVFGTEYLLPAEPARSLARFRNRRPYYETYGEQQVAAGHYDEPIRYTTHVEPLVYAVRRELGLRIPAHTTESLHSQPR